MNKQQLAAHIWRVANKMRSKIDASTYKDYILGFIFYRFLCENEERYLREKRFYEDEDMKELTSDNRVEKAEIQKQLGYYIEYRHLVSTWLAKGVDFNVGDATDALNSFEHNIAENARSVFGGVFSTLSKGIPDLGENAQKQTAAVKDLLTLINPIPMDGKEDYDVLGFIYEYLIGNFAANAGKKAGEFYTPREVAILMSDIVAHELRGKEHISIYDPTSGSASLLLTIGTSIARHNGNPDSIKYYAQEYIGATYNLTRMNLVMRGVNISNIVTRNADTLADDWPIDIEHGMTPLVVDACVSNPPYSQHWDQPTTSDPRFADYGLAPKTKADYAFLLHNLYHLHRDGIMTIVLPHGVLFRGDAEEQIRKRLLERHQISAVIGLPANIFFGTGIPTIVMVLKKQRDESDVLFIDASKHFLKDGKKNRLQESDVRRIYDAYVAREDVPGYAHVATMEEIERNGYNLNIPRYVDSSDPVEPIDIYATMFGGIPVDELDELNDIWTAFPKLRETLFHEQDGSAERTSITVKDAIESDADVLAWKNDYESRTQGVRAMMESSLLHDPEQVAANATEELLLQEFRRSMSDIPLVDYYDAYQRFAEAWNGISTDLEMIQTEGFENAVRQVDAHMVLKNKNSNDEAEVQDKDEPWLGHILPFDLVQKKFMAERIEALDGNKNRLESIDADIESVFGELDAEERDGAWVKEDSEEFDFKEVAKKIDEDIRYEVPEISGLLQYLAFNSTKPKKDELLAFYEEHKEVDWSAMKMNGQKKFKVGDVKARIAEIKATIELPEDTLLGKLMAVEKLNNEAKALKKIVNAEKNSLIEDTKAHIEEISTEDALSVLKAKWVDSLAENLDGLAASCLSNAQARIEALSTKYDTTLADLDREISSVEKELHTMLGMLTGNDRDMAGIKELAALLGGE